MNVPEWRSGAVFHRALTDADGLMTGREVTVYPTLYGSGRMCEGTLAAEIYDHEFLYESVGEAVHAAEEWDGVSAPPGKWRGYKSKVNGDQIKSEDGDPTPEERRKLVNNLIESSAPDVKRAHNSMVALGEATNAASESFRAVAGQIRVREMEETIEVFDGEGWVGVDVDNDEEAVTFFKGETSKTLAPHHIVRHEPRPGEGQEYVTLQKQDKVTTHRSLETNGIIDVTIERLEIPAETGGTGPARRHTWKARVLDTGGDTHDFKEGSRFRCHEHNVGFA